LAASAAAVTTATATVAHDVDAGAQWVGLCAATHASALVAVAAVVVTAAFAQSAGLQVQTVALQVLALAWVGKVAFLALAIVLCGLGHALLWRAVVVTVVLRVGCAWASGRATGRVRGAPWALAIEVAAVVVVALHAAIALAWCARAAATSTTGGASSTSRWAASATRGAASTAAFTAAFFAHAVGHFAARVFSGRCHDVAARWLACAAPQSPGG
jgi:hypothetical protein